MIVVFSLIFLAIILIFLGIVAVMSYLAGLVAGFYFTKYFGPEKDTWNLT